jgi:hypothetical protein
LPYVHEFVQEFPAWQQFPRDKPDPRQSKVAPGIVYISLQVPSSGEIKRGGLSERGETLLDLIVNLDVLALILPLGEFLLVELLLELGLHVGHLLLLGATLVDQLLGTTGRTRQHGCYRNNYYQV